jgi:hypothetical protein
LEESKTTKTQANHKIHIKSTKKNKKNNFESVPIELFCFSFTGRNFFPIPARGLKTGDRRPATTEQMVQIHQFKKVRKKNVQHCIYMYCICIVFT